MTRKNSSLRALTADEVPEPPKIFTLGEAIADGDYLQILLAQRREIAADLPTEKGPAKAAMHRMMRDISKEIEQLQSRDSDESEGGADVEDGQFDAEAI